MGDIVQVSIIITAFNQHHEFMNLMAGIEIQIRKNPSICSEIIIVDNGSDPPLATIHNIELLGVPVRYLYRTPVPRNFRPASSRNMGIQASSAELILFIDGDCIPGPTHLQSHFQRLATARGPLITLGHRIFIDGKNADPEAIRAHECNLSYLPEIASSSNYSLNRDRRMEEFGQFDEHPMPFHCCHGCNLGVRRVDLRTGGGFDEEFDGYWGYEDIEFGYRIWAAGARLEYLPDAFVFHQESISSSSLNRALEAPRNFELACAKIPRFREYRASLNRSYYKTAIGTASSACGADCDDMHPR